MALLHSDGYSVRDLQTALREISRHYPEISRVAIDGVFGPETTNAVSGFQRRFGLNPSGKADFETWNKIREIYSSLLLQASPPEPLHPFPSTTAVIAPGSNAEIVSIIQVILRSLNRLFANFDSVVINGVYDDRLALQVRRFQEAAQLPETGTVDKATWNRLARWYGIYHPREE